MTDPILTPEQSIPAHEGSTPNSIVNTLISALESRQQRVERSVTRDMAAQYGMTEQELTALLNNHRAEKARQLPPEAQQLLDAANARVESLLLQSEVVRLGAAMGLVDPEAAILLMDRGQLQSSGNGVTGVQEALDALKQTKPYLFSAAAQPIPHAWGQPHGSGGDHGEASFRRALGLQPKQ